MKTIFVDAVDCFVSDKGVIFQEMYDLLETYENKKIIVTGANDEQFKTFGLDKMPYEVFTLKHDPEKTHPKYFKMLLEKYRLEMDEAVYFEHNRDAVESAEAVGITAYWYDNEEKDLSALKKFLDSNL